MNISDMGRGLWMHPKWHRIRVSIGEASENVVKKTQSGCFRKKFEIFGKFEG